MDDDEDLDETERGTFEDRMLAHAARQTKAVESMQSIMWGWTALAIIGIVVWVIVLAKNGF